MKTALTVVTTLVLTIGCRPTARGDNVPQDEATETAITASAPQTVPASQESKTASSTSEPPAADTRQGKEDRTGPTVLLSYEQGTLERNPIQAFMYFVPLISPVAVDRQTTAENSQRVGIVSYEKKVTSRTFSLNCEYEIKGSGFSRYQFDPPGMIALKIAESKKPNGEPLTNVLDYIHFEGEGYGSVRVKGTINGTTETVTEVDLEFNARGCTSPAVVGLYDVKAKNHQYGYENRSNQIVARVNTLTFKKSEDPRMGITVACITKKGGSNGFFGQLKAAIANLFLKPAKITPLGNQTMLDFGRALLDRKTAFTFPQASNLKDAIVAAAEPNGSRPGTGQEQGATR
jgi:hypothetical protein